MAAYIEAGGVRTWYDEHGEGDPVALLHPGGAGVDAGAWRPNLDAVAARFPVFTRTGAATAKRRTLRVRSASS